MDRAAAILASEVSAKVETPKKRSATQAMISTKNAINTLLGRLDKMRDAILEKREVCGKMFSQFAEGQDDAACEALKRGLADVNCAVQKAKVKLESAKAECMTISNDALDTSDVAALDGMKHQVRSLVDTALKEDVVKAASTTMTEFKKNVADAKRDVGKPPPPTPTSEIPAIVPIATSILGEINKIESMSFFEAKAGLKVARQGCQEATETVLKLPIVKTSLKKVLDGKSWTMMEVLLFIVCIFIIIVITTTIIITIIIIILITTTITIIISIVIASISIIVIIIIILIIIIIFVIVVIIISIIVVIMAIISIGIIFLITSFSSSSPS